MRSFFLHTLPRALALSLGAFASLNLLGEWVRPGFDANLWWIDLRPLPQLAADLFVGLAAIALLWFGADPRPGPTRRRWTLIASVTLSLIALENAVHFWWLHWRGDIVAGFPLPFSLLVVASCTLISVSLTVEPVARQSFWTRAACVPALVMLALAFPLAQMWCFGTTDYRRPADALVVFGSRVYADGSLSLSLADRVRTGCRLYKQGLAKKIVFSGGPGDGPIHETEAMRRLARALDIPDEDIIVDRDGLDTWSTVHNTRDLLKRHRMSRVLAVSHFYHLPRIKMTLQRAGLEAYPVPAHETRTLLKLPAFVAREVAAFWFYYARGLSKPQRSR